MRAEAFLAAAEDLPFAGLSDIMGDGGLVIVAPHPDDESLGCGGLIAEARARDIDVRLVILSDGVGSHPNSRSYPPRRLRALRQQETTAAGSALGLGPAAISFLQLPDGHVQSTGPVAASAVKAIVEVARDCHASAICTTWRYDPHCDHEAAAALVEFARPHLPQARICAYPVWGWALPAEVDVGDAPCGFRLDISGRAQSKSAAIACHRSQVTDLIDDDPTGFRLDAAMLERSRRNFEIFLVTYPEGSAS